MLKDSVTLATGRKWGGGEVELVSQKGFLENEKMAFLVK